MTRLLALRLAVGLGLTLFCGGAPWALQRKSGRLIGMALAGFVAVAAIGVVIGLALYPLSNLVVLGVAISGGVLVGRAVPARFAPFLTLLVVLSLLDLAQGAIFNGPPPGPASGAGSAPNPHLIWVNFRVPLPSGHFNIGFADLLLITAMAEHLRRRQAAYFTAVLPAIIGLLLADAIGSIRALQALLGGVLIQVLVPYLALGWLITVMLAVRVKGLSRSTLAATFD